MVGATSCLCPTPWVPFRDYCYRFERQATTFHNAEEICQSYSQMDDVSDSHLVSVHDTEEGSFLFDTSVEIFGTGDSWIGLNDIQEEGHFVWTDGSAYDYSNFNPSEPNNLNNEDCIHMLNKRTAGLWNDKLCTVLKPFVCKRAQWQWANNCYLN
ncbi:hypothetical protein BSL78_03090 [Apostichopus japonicus]|uniref:C-type lectin domain-containing protein n=1 Tax=Stichopus japonicus TaxID=307972 RepID=A0A2G8LIF0_STIJA|nr:hypothetical protein BSL78_03090 [Apostichopus japonicus]